jgi:hypothetical protein
MLTWDELKKAKLGHRFAVRELENSCRAIYGSVAWPGKKPGFAVVLAMSRSKENDSDSHEICLLDEYESSDMQKLIEQCGVLNRKYEPEMWVGDTTNDSAEEFMYEMRDDLDFYLSETDLTEMNPLYPYILGKLKELRNERHRRLFLQDDSKLLNYMGEIETGEIAELERGAFPAIEALGYAVIEMQRVVESVGHLPSHTWDAGLGPDEGEFDHLLRPGATDPGLEYDDDYEDDY